MYTYMYMYMYIRLFNYNALLSEDLALLAFYKEIYQFGRATTCSYVNYDVGIVVIKRHCG